MDEPKDVVRPGPTPPGIPGVGPSLPYAVKAGVTYARSAAWMARTGGRAKATGLRVLLYHRVADDDDPLAVPTRRFAGQMAKLAADGYRALGLMEALSLLQTGDLPERTVGLTFDDGFADVRDEALPILERHGFGATVFITTGVTDGRVPFPWYTGPQPPVLGWDDIAALDREGTLKFEAHTVTHPSLLILDEESARAEIRDSRVELTERLGRPVTAFAYPAGLFGEREQRLAEEAGYLAAVSCEPGVNVAEHRPLRAPPPADRPARPAWSTSPRRCAAATTPRCPCATPTAGCATGCGPAPPDPGARARPGRRRGARRGTGARRSAPVLARGLPRPSTRADPASASRSSSAAARAAGSPGGTSRPVTPSTTSSATPPTSEAMTGSPAAIASRIEIGAPSERLASTKTLDAGQELRDVEAVAGQSHLALEPERAHRGLDGGPLGTAAHEQRADRPVAQAAERVHERQRILRIREPPHRDDLRRLVAGAGAAGRLDVDRVRDHDRAPGPAGPGGQAGDPLALGHADRHGGQAGHQAVGLAVQPRHAAGVRRERPAVDGEDPDRHTGERRRPAVPARRPWSCWRARCRAGGAASARRARAARADRGPRAAVAARGAARRTARRRPGRPFSRGRRRERRRRRRSGRPVPAAGRPRRSALRRARRA